MEVKVKKERRKETESGKGRKAFRKYWLFVLFGTLTAAGYPIYMGIKVLRNMALYGFVPQARYPKYIIPYTPIAIAVVVAVCLMPLLFKKVKAHRLLAASGISLAVFFVSELLLEHRVIVNGTIPAKLDSWQMFMCYVPPERYQSRDWRAVDILIGEYSPTFKLHFYFISVILILTILNSLYGFGQMVLTGNREKKRILTVQSAATGLFLGLCILACFTAFFRDGELLVSSLSATLMGVFFMLFGVTAGIYTGSFLLGRKRCLAVGLPALVSVVTTLGMYIGELFLLNGHLYLLGTGFWFKTLPGIVLAPIDLLIILSAGAVGGGICLLLNGKEGKLLK